jgi:Pyridoxal-phosphate dependent enzyme
MAHDARRASTDNLVSVVQADVDDRALVGVGNRAGGGGCESHRRHSLHPFPLPPKWGISLYLKDESVHPTGSLKHRLARSLVLYGLCNNWINEDTTLVEASSGPTAVSEAYFARLLHLPFVAVMPASTVREKIELIDLEEFEASGVWPSA